MFIEKFIHVFIQLFKHIIYHNLGFGGCYHGYVQYWMTEYKSLD